MGSERETDNPQNKKGTSSFDVEVNVSMGNEDHAFVQNGDEYDDESTAYGYNGFTNNYGLQQRSDESSDQIEDLSLQPINECSDEISKLENINDLNSDYESPDCNILSDEQIEEKRMENEKIKSIEKMESERLAKEEERKRQQEIEKLKEEE